VEKRKSMDFETIAYEVKEKIARITMNRRRQDGGFITTAMWRELQQALDLVEEDRTVRVLILEGAGENFSLGWYGPDSPYTNVPGGYDQWGTGGAVKQMTLIRDQYKKLLFFPKPTIAKVHGKAALAGCNLQLFCDLTIAAENAQFGHPAMVHGGVEIVPWIFFIGPKKAKELWFTGKYIDGVEAEKIGMINKAVPLERLEAETWGMATTVAKVPLDNDAMPGHGIRLTKAVFNGAMELMGLSNLFNYHLLGNAWGHSGLGKSEMFKPTGD